MSRGSNPRNVARPELVKPPRPMAQVAPTQSAVAQPTAAQPAAMRPYTAPNVFQQSAGAYNSALQGTQAAGMMGFRPPQAQAFGYDAAMAGSQGYDAALMDSAPQVSGMDLNPYMNPFTQNVIDRSIADIGSAQQQSMGQLGAQAAAAKAFGGSRHGVAEALTNQGFIKQMADTTSGLNLQNFQNAQGMAQFDIGNRMAQMQANQGALNQSRAFGAGAANTASLTNAGAQNNARQFYAGARNNASLANQNAGLQGAQLGLQAAGQMGALSQQGFNMGNTLNQQQMQQGQMQQMIQQALIDAAKGQYAGFTGAPGASLQLPLAAVGAANMGQNTTTAQNNPGLLGILGTGASILGSLCWVAREVYGEEDARWTEFRHWLLTAAPKWLLNAYAKHGEAFAGVVRKVPVLKRVLRPLMDRARRAAGFEG